jgi:hypothetical protein
METETGKSKAPPWKTTDRLTSKVMDEVKGESRDGMAEPEDKISSLLTTVSGDKEPFATSSSEQQGAQPGSRRLDPVSVPG